VFALDLPEADAKLLCKSVRASSPACRRIVPFHGLHGLAERTDAPVAVTDAVNGMTLKYESVIQSLEIKRGCQTAGWPL
jgi:hypothetical protein